MRKLRVVLFLMMLAVCGLTSSAVNAADQLKIAATVGDEAITTYDTISRTKLIIFSSGLPADQETFRKILPQGMQSLISDKLVEQEAARLNITATEEDMKGAMDSIERKNNLEAGQMKKTLENSGIPYSTLESQVRAQILMAKIRQIRIRPLISISDDEVEDFVRAQSFNQQVDEYFLNEIVLPVETPEDDAKVKELADKLHSELRSGGDFAKIAREFSASGSAYNDGKVGWMPENQIPKEILAEIKKNDIGAVSDPVRSIEGYFIVKATEKREQNSIAQENEVNLKQYEMPFPEKSDQKAIKALTDKLLGLSYEDDACNQPDVFAAKHGVTAKDYGQVKMGDIEPKIRPLITDIEIGVFSKPIVTQKSALVFLVCERIENIAPLVDDNKRDEARQALFERKMELQSRKYIRDLRRRTNIEIRL